MFVCLYDLPITCMNLRINNMSKIIKILTSSHLFSLKFYYLHTSKLNNRTKHEILIFLFINMKIKDRICVVAELLYCCK